MRGLEQFWVGRRYQVPPQGVQVGGKDVRSVEAFRGQVVPVRLLQYLCVRLPFPKYGQALALGIVFQAGEVDKRLLPAVVRCRLDSLHQVSPAANFHNLAK